MPGVKTNERPGTRAVLRHYRMSATKARQVLDLIRGQDVDRAAEILRTTEREAATVVGKVLASAVANAVHNDGQDAEELYVSACYADEGTTLKRWRPRARGRATRIRKRTCHITVIVSRLPDDRLARRRAEREVAGGQRSRRVAESRRRADLSGRLSRRRHAQEEAAAAAAEAEAEAEAQEAEVEDELVDDAVVEQSAEDIVEAAAEADDDDDADAETDGPVPTWRPRTESDTDETEADAHDAEAAATDTDETEADAHDAATESDTDESDTETETDDRRGPPSPSRSPRRRPSSRPGVDDEEEGQVDGPEGQPLRVPPRRDHRLEVALVRGAPLPGLRRRGLEDPRLPDVPARGGRRQPHRGRAHP